MSHRTVPRLITAILGPEVALLNKPASHDVKPQRDGSLKDGRVPVVFFEIKANYR